MFNLIADVLAWFYELWPSFGMSIVFLTLVVMLILTPLTLKGTRSMMMMQALQPEVKKLQQQYKDDRQKLNEEMLKFYRENKINPLGGCAPLLVQLPVFFVLYRVLSQLTRRGDDGTFNPGYIADDSALYQALDGKDEMVSWGFDLSQSATQAMSDSFATALPYLLLIIGVAVTSFVQQRQVAGRNPNSTVNPQQQMLMRVLPLFFAVISIGFPAALVVYFFVSNLFRVGQQALISHTIYRPAVASGVFEAKAREASGDDKPETPEQIDKPDKPEKPAKLDRPAKGERKPASDAGEAPSAERRGFLDRLLGDSRPRPGQAAQASGQRGGQGARQSRDGQAAARPANRPTGGRTTTPGTPGAARKKRKKKR